MTRMSPTDFADLRTADLQPQLMALVDEHRVMLAACLDDLTEEEARARLVPSRTTLLGLVKHVTFVEGVWFGEAFTGRSRAELGLARTPDASFVLEPGDTIDSVRAAHADAVARSREAMTGRSLDDVVSGNRRGDLSIRWVLLHLVRELAQHCGHADILREQVLAARSRG